MQEYSLGSVFGSILIKNFTIPSNSKASYSLRKHWGAVAQEEQAIPAQPLQSLAGIKKFWGLGHFTSTLTRRNR